MRDVVLDTNVLVAGVPTPQYIDDFVEYLPVKIGPELFPLEADLCRTRRRSILKPAVRTRSPIITFNTKDSAGAERFGIKVILRTCWPFSDAWHHSYDHRFRGNSTVVQQKSRQRRMSPSKNCSPRPSKSESLSSNG